MVTRNNVKKDPAPTVPSRRRVADESEDNTAPAASYFASGTDKKLEFVSTGCSILDEVIGGGMVLGRMINIVGDKSSGKTLMAIEACANFDNIYRSQDGYIRYAEAEAAFDIPYAAALGMPVDRVDFADSVFTVEDLFEDLTRILDDPKMKDRPILYVVDSLDALSDRAEQDRKIDEGTMGMAKPKLLGQLFRRLVQRMEESRMLLLIISQIRDKIGVTFGEKQTRSGGKAMDFYASQVVWLSEIEKMKRTIDKVERVTGVRVRARCKKNKIGLPFRECEYPILFGYGIDDLTAATEWLIDVGKEERLAAIGLSKAGYKVRIGNVRGKGGEGAKELRGQLKTAVIEEWRAIEMKFLPPSGKYG